MTARKRQVGDKPPSASVVAFRDNSEAIDTYVTVCGRPQGSRARNKPSTGAVASPGTVGATRLATANARPLAIQDNYSPDDDGSLPGGLVPGSSVGSSGRCQPWVCIQARFSGVSGGSSPADAPPVSVMVVAQ